MTARSAATTIDEYIAEFPRETRDVLEQMRAPQISTTDGALRVHSGRNYHVQINSGPAKGGLARASEGEGVGAAISRD